MSVMAMTLRRNEANDEGEVTLSSLGVDFFAEAEVVDDGCGGSGGGCAGSFEAEADAATAAAVVVGVAANEAAGLSDDLIFGGIDNCFNE